MAQFYTDFSEYPTGSPPGDWSDQWATSINDIVSDAGVEGGVLLNHVSDGSHTAFAWLNNGAANIEVVAKLQLHDDQDLSQGVVGRADSSGGGYKVAGDGGGSPSIRDIDGGSTLANGSKSFADGAVVWIRFRCNGDTLEAKMWEDGTGEPSSFDVSTTDTAYSSGLPAVTTFLDRDVDYHLFGVGTEGDTAPTEPVDTGGPVDLAASGASTGNGSTPTERARGIPASGVSDGDGTASSTLARVISASGSGVASALSTVARSRTVSASGAATGDGVTPAERVRTHAATGAAAGAGAVAVQRTRQAESAGAATATGAVTVGVTRGYAASGATTSNGDGRVVRSRSSDMTGSATGISTVDIERSRQFEGSGAGTASATALLEDIAVLLQAVGSASAIGSSRATRAREVESGASALAESTVDMQATRRMSVVGQSTSAGEATTVRLRDVGSLGHGNADALTRAVRARESALSGNGTGFGFVTPESIVLLAASGQATAAGESSTVRSRVSPATGVGSGAASTTLQPVVGFGSTGSASATGNITLRRLADLSALGVGEADGLGTLESLQVLLAASGLGSGDGTVALVFPERSFTPGLVGASKNRVRGEPAGANVVIQVSESKNRVKQETEETDQ